MCETTEPPREASPRDLLTDDVVVAALDKVGPGGAERHHEDRPRVARGRGSTVQLPVRVAHVIDHTLVIHLLAYLGEEPRRKGVGVRR